MHGRCTPVPGRLRYWLASITAEGAGHSLRSGFATDGSAKRHTGTSSAMAAGGRQVRCVAMSADGDAGGDSLGPTASGLDFLQSRASYAPTTRPTSLAGRTIVHVRVLRWCCLMTAVERK